MRRELIFQSSNFTSGQLAQILELQKSLVTSPNRAPGEKGFLISNFEEMELERLTENGASLFTASDVSGLAGYMLVTAMGEFTRLFENSKSGVFRPYSSEFSFGTDCKYLYQIAIKRGGNRKGVGTQLFNYALGVHSVSFITDILLEPICNLASLRFFEKNGFRRIGVLELSHYRDFGALKSQVLMFANAKSS
jgi:hypothetical protein